MVISRASAFFSAPGLALGLLLVTAGCQTVDPVNIYSSPDQDDQGLATVNPSDIAVLTVENATGDPSVDRHLAVFRQDLMKYLVERCYAPARQSWVDASLLDLRREAGSATAHALEPTWLKKAAAAVAEDAVLAMRIDRWDESKLLIDRRVYFQLEAAMMAKDGKLLWRRTISGDVKAGGAGAAPRVREDMARSCITIAVQQLLLRLPSHRADSR